MEILLHLFLIEVKWTAVIMECDVCQTAGIVGKSALAFAGKFNGAL
jgi:hypothetical protein|tara:strand:+ start:242 stop:379 length:138 start_codon:yes stop_codon:yes gene_type:complete